jgi:hypothetical protein
MSLYRQAPEGWHPKVAYRNLLAKRVPATTHETATFSQRVDRVASTFMAAEVRLMASDKIVGRQIDINDGLHRVADVPEYLYDRHHPSGETDV